MSKVIKTNSDIPYLTTSQMVEVDRLMIEEYGIQLLQMMENAGRCLSVLAVDRFLKKKLNLKRVIILAGTGGNAGGVMVCARRLHSCGVKVKVYLSSDEDKMKPVSYHQLGILKRMGIKIRSGEELSNANPASLVIDGIIGYSIKGNPLGTAGKMIEWANKQLAPILSLDTPSGLDVTSGEVHSPTIQATATLTLALPKIGLFENGASKVAGDLYLGNIGVPTDLYAEPSLGLKVKHNLFAKRDVLRINQSGRIKGDFPEGDDLFQSN